MSESASSGCSVRVANLLIAGVGKSGSTSLFRYLAQHPDICGSSVKETHYFTPARLGDPLPPITKYEQFFAHCAGEPFRLEASPDYCLGGEQFIAQLRQTLGRVRVIILLRDPGERLWDSFWYMKARERIPGISDFEQYVEQRLKSMQDVSVAEMRSRHGGWAKSFYGDYVGTWLDAFGDDLRIVFFEHFIADPVATVEQLCTWLGLDGTLAAGFCYAEHNVTYVPRSRGLQRLSLLARRHGDRWLRHHPGMHERLRRQYLAIACREQVLQMDDDMRQQLRALFRESNERLRVQLEKHGYRRFPAWLTDLERPA